MKILIIKNDGIGDLILASGLISYLGREIATRLDLITCQNNEEIAESIENVDNIFYVSRDSIKRYHILNPNRISIPWRRAKDQNYITRFNIQESQAIKIMNEVEYDLIIVLRRYIRQSSLELLQIIKSKKKLCMWETPTNITYQSARKLSANTLHLKTENIERYIKPELEYFEAILSLYFKKEIKANPELKLTSIIDLNSQKNVGLIISGSSVQISIENWIKLCQYIKTLGFNITIFGGYEQIEISKRIQEVVMDIENKVGKVNFKNYKKEFSELSHIIGNDTGLTHYSSLIHSKILVILGGGTFGSFFPWREKGPQEVVYHRMECYNCLWVCDKNHECISSLFYSKRFFDAIKSFLLQAM